jgi:hypothetical protein
MIYDPASGMAQLVERFVSLPYASVWTRPRLLPFHTESVIGRASPFRLRFLSGGRFGVSILELYKARLRKMVVPTHLPVLSCVVKRRLKANTTDIGGGKVNALRYNHLFPPA